MNASSLQQASRSAARDGLLKVSNLSTSQLHEVWASTKAYPGWWTELEDNRALRRRSSVDEPILERNLCFVDTPGYGQGLSITEGIQEVTSYIEAQLARSSSASINSGGEMVNMLSGYGGAQVDVVLYLHGRGMKSSFSSTRSIVDQTFRDQTCGSGLPPALDTDHQRHPLTCSSRSNERRRHRGIEIIVAETAR